MRRRWLVAGAALLLLAGCTGVPSSSSPQTVESLGLGAATPQQSISPKPNASPRDIVAGFLAANSADPGRHTSARLFLTPQARNHWSDSTATIIDREQFGTFDAATSTFTVVGRIVGSLDKDGIYTPALERDTPQAPLVHFQFKLAQVDGEYRIDVVRPGLLLTETQFSDDFTRHALYFYDDAEQYLIPDPRYTDIDDDRQLSDWLLAELAAGPRPALQNAVTSDTFPAQADATRNTVQVGSPTKVEVPGSGQLDPPGRHRLAAQLAQTLSDALAGGTMEITDGGAPVSIPGLGDTFVPSDFNSALNRPPLPADVYYLDGGRVYDQTARRLGGPLGRGVNDLTAIGAGQPTPSGTVLFAGLTGIGSHRRLLTGNAVDGLRATSVTGALTRPAFAPGRAEVWIGDGTHLLRQPLAASTGFPSGRTDDVPTLQGTAPGRILAVRISPDGARIALVIAATATATSGALCIGSLVRTGGQVRIDALAPISPQLTYINDVAWLNSLKLFAIGRQSTSQDPLTFDTGVDGTDWTVHTLGLSDPADSVTVTAGASAWVSAGYYVWRQSVGEWVPPLGDQTVGTQPVYLE